MARSFELIPALSHGFGILAILAILSVAYGAIRLSSFGPKGQALLLGGATSCAVALGTIHQTHFSGGCELDSGALVVGISSAFGGPITALVGGGFAAIHSI
ncbi:hypothetical protein [Fulvimarina sp. MAC3]|uniref:hypothetical protein n=1 Tax=Fulvimarina sp. MAC3 TaxID=3148887 RepID=UPI0031FD9939